jgi:uncharacterized membrane protein (TIGR02234 family)
MNRARTLAIVGLIVGSGIALMSYLPTWVSYMRRSDGLPGINSVFSGRQVAPAAVAAALLVLAGSVAVWAVRGAWVRVVGVVLMMASGYLVFVPIAFAIKPELGLAVAMTGATGQSEATLFLGAIVTTSWWIPALVGGLWALVAAIVVVFHRRRWEGMSARYSRAGLEPGEPKTARTGAAAWDALDRGDDPTIRADEATSAPPAPLPGVGSELPE